MSDDVQRYAVLRDYPLRLWAWQTEHFEALLREFSLLLLGSSSRESRDDAPAQLVALAEMFTTRYGTLIDEINQTRAGAYAAGLDRIDSRVPLVEGLPALLAQVHDVFAAVDGYCRSGQLLTLARPPELLALAEWSTGELVGQYAGEEPKPWPGPF